jgi:uncharacterized protein (TIGR02453 family)
VGYFDDETLAFLRELRRNNDREWFAANKQRYERSVREPMLQFVADVGPALRKLSPNLVADPRPVGGSMFRIHRDVRFSRDKSPYKTHLGAHFPLGRGTAGPGYYLHVEPGGCFLAGGIWMPDAATLHAIRTRIAERPAEWRTASGDLDPTEDALKRAPRGFDPDHPMAEDIKRKHYTASFPLSDQQIKRDDLVTTFVRGCRDVAPLMRFLAAATGARW